MPIITVMVTLLTSHMVELVSKDVVFERLDSLLQAIEPSLDSVSKLDYPYNDCIDFDFDSSTFDRSDKVRIGRIALRLIYCEESIRNILDLLYTKFG